MALYLDITEDPNFYVYRHIRLDSNEVFYVGIGKRYDKSGFHSRKYNRMYSKQRNRFWKNITSKTNYEVEIIFDDLTLSQACKKEIEFIKLYGRRDLKLGSLVNLTDGGEGNYGRIVSDAERKIKSQQHSGDKNFWFGKCRTGNKNPMYGLKGKNNPNFGRKFSAERNNKISSKLKGNYAGFKGEWRCKLTPGNVLEIRAYYSLHKKTIENKIILEVLSKKYNITQCAIKAWIKDIFIPTPRHLNFKK